MDVRPIYVATLPPYLPQRDGNKSDQQQQKEEKADSEKKKSDVAPPDEPGSQVDIVA